MTQRRLAAILAADVSGFSAAMAADEDGTLASLHDLRRTIDPILEGHGGRIASTAGDSVVAEFPSVAEAVDAAVEIQGETEGSPLRLRIGINLGDIIVTDDGDVFGDGVNIAARLEAIADTGGIVVSSAVRNSLRGRSPVGFEDLGELRLKHIDEPVQAFRAVLERSAPAAAPRPAVDGPVLVERDDELRRLREALAGAVAGAGSIVVIGGEAGIGKSSLVRAIAAEAGIDVLWGWCDDLVIPRALGPFHDMAPDLGPAFASLLAADPRPETILRALHESLAGGPPRLVVIEDLHWADDATIDALKFLGRRIRHLAALVVVTVRDVGAARVRTTLADAAPGSVVRLQPAPLSAAAIAALAGDTVPAERLRRLTGGNPFFLSEVLEAGTDVVPSSVQDAVLARVDALSGPARRIAEVVSVGPVPVDLAIIGDVTPVDDAALDELESARILVGVGNAMAFRHELARRAVEASLSARDRRSINLAVLSGLETLDADPARLAHHALETGDPSLIVRHSRAAGAAASRSHAYGQAAGHYRRALEHEDLMDRAILLEVLSDFARSVGFQDVPEAIAATERRLAMNREDGDVLGESDDLRWLSRLAWMEGRGSDARALAAEAIDTVSHLPPSKQLARAYARRSQLAMLSGDAEGTEEWGRKAIELADELDLPGVRVQAMVNVGTVVTRTDPDESVRILQAAIRLADEIGIPQEIARATGNLGWNRALARRYAEAIDALDDAERVAVEHEMEGYASYALAAKAWVCLETGSWDEALTNVETSLTGRAVAAVAEIPALTVRGTIVARRGDLERAAEIAGQAWEGAERSEEAQRIVPVANLLAEIAWLRGDPSGVATWARAAHPYLARDGNSRYGGDLARWVRLSESFDGTALVSPPHDLEAAGRYVEAAAAWAELGCPYDEALAWYEAGDVGRAIEILEGLGAVATIERISPGTA
ncbi:MAG TPA: AAA family ATPase [Acidimicrobiia bacterium]|nr:AAA family ATPase [Acidimicrobiia bacterium]